MSSHAAPDNSSWLSLVSGEQVEAPKLMTLEDVVAYRSHPTRDLRRHNVDLPENVEIRKVHLGEPEGIPTAAEVYIPHGTGPYPMMLYMHGGGWCLGSAEYVRKLGMTIADRGHTVVNLDYALAPEHPFPAALKQAIFAARWMVKHAHEVKGKEAPIAIGGASAGANLACAAMVSLLGDDADHLSDGHLAVEFSAAVLLYGVFNFPLLMQEPGSHAGGFAEMMFNHAYLGPHYLLKHRDPLVSPALAPNLHLFPPCYLLIGDQDSLLPQSLDMTKRLVGNGVQTTLSVAAGLDHSFAYIPHLVPSAAAELQRMLDWLVRHTYPSMEDGD